MDFDLSEEQQAVSELAAQILRDKVTEERLRELGAGGDLFDDQAWAALCEAGLVGICLPEADGGSGFGTLEACLVLEEVGRRVAPVPYLVATCGARAVAALGTEAQRADLLPGAIDGSSLLIPAVAEPGTYAPPVAPATTATPDGDGWRLDGEKHFVPWADRAHRLLVPARMPDGGVGVFLVAPTGEGVGLEPLVTTSGLPEHHVVLAGAPVDAAARLGGDVDASAGVQRLLDELTVGTCAVQSGVSAEALRMTAAYTSERKQFDTPIATFQAVAQRAADAYIDAQGVRFTMLQAAWRLAEGLPAADELDVAAFWAADGGQRVANAAQHLHGGIGVDTDYPLHRYFLWAKQLELAFGGATEHLRRLGGRLAA